MRAKTETVSFARHLNFSEKYRVVALDLAGPGHSGTARTRHSMGAFGEDVRAAAEAASHQSVMPTGHSMGGPVIAEAARPMPNRVIGLIGTDTLEDIEHPLDSSKARKDDLSLEEGGSGSHLHFSHRPVCGVTPTTPLLTRAMAFKKKIPG